MRKIAKKDDNQNEIEKDLLRVGFSVLSLHQLGNDIPDLLVARCGFTALVEIKSEKGKLTKGQAKFKMLWAGLCFTARSSIEIIQRFEKLTKGEIK